MSEVKRYDISAFGGMSMDECSDGAYVNYDDYATLEAKCAALAAENAGMSARTPVAYSYRYAGCETCDGFQDWRWELSKEKPPEWMLETGKVTNLVELFELHETTATNSFMAEVLAQGVDSAINRVIAMMNHQHPVTSKAIDIMRVHAYQLRKVGEQKWQSKNNV